MSFLYLKIKTKKKINGVFITKIINFINISKVYRLKKTKTKRYTKLITK